MHRLFVALRPPPDIRDALVDVMARFGRGSSDAGAIARWVADHAALTTAAFTLPHLILYESHLGHEGARYEPVVRWSLAPGVDAR